MAKFVLKNAEVKIDPGADDSVSSADVIDLSDFVQSVTFNISKDTPEATAMGDLDRVRLHGLREWSVDITFFQDFDSGSVDATLWDIIDNDKFVTLWVKADSTTAISATNPQYTGRAVLPGHTPVSGTVGDVSTISVTFNSSRPLTRNTGA